MNGIDLRITNYKKIKDNKYNYRVAIIPWGSTEPHNLHLPYLTDCILSKEIALRVVENIENNKQRDFQNRTIVFPEIPMGSQNPGQTDYPFCIHYTQETQKNILKDIVNSLEHQHIYKILIINGHMGNCFKPIIRDIKQTNPNTDIIVVDWLNIPELPHSKYFDNKEDHAGEIETSAMMYLHPELVKLSDAGPGFSKGFSMPTLKRKIGWTPRNWKYETEDSGIGDPKLSTVDKGKSYINDVVDLISQLLSEFIESSPYAI